MSKVKLTIRRVFSYLVATEPHWPWISSWILQNFLRYPLSCLSPKIHLQDLWKHFQFVLDQNLGHFQANLFDRAEIIMQAILVIGVYFWPWNAAWRWWNPTWLRETTVCAQFHQIKKKMPYYQHIITFLKFLVCVHAGDLRVPPRVMASGPKPCGGNKFNRYSNCNCRSNQMQTLIYLEIIA